MKTINVFANRKIFFGVSIGLVIIGILCSIFMGVELDIQFKGGVMLRYSFTSDVDHAQVQQIAEEKLGDSVAVQENTNAAGERQLVLNAGISDSISTETKAALDQALQEAFPDANIESAETQNVAANMGREFLLRSVLAVVLAAILIILYVWFRFRKIGGLSAGVVAVIALLLDMSMAFFAFVIFRIPLNDIFIAVVLTIFGYSINSTIVIFDRVRENERLLGKKYPIDELVDRSITQCFFRCLNTSLMTFLVMLVLAIFAIVSNLSSIISFAVPMMFGIASGFYSSTFITGPLWVMWIKHKEKKQQKDKKHAPANA